jgi:hypothetical protein
VNTQIVNPAPWPSQDLEVLGQAARLFEAGPSSNAGETPQRHDPAQRPLVLVVNGNGFVLDDCDDMAGYLAAKGFTSSSSTARPRTGQTLWARPSPPSAPRSTR